MLELEKTNYTMNEDETMEVVVNRVGGTKGKVNAILNANPGTAVQGDFDTEPKKVVLNDGEKETKVPVTTKRNTNNTGDQDFSIELTTPSENLIIGFNKKATIIIKDTESVTTDALKALLKECKKKNSECYVEGWKDFAAAMKEAENVINKQEPTSDEIHSAYTKLENAKDKLVERTQYSQDDRYAFPSKMGVSSVLEAEFMALNNTGENEAWPLKVTEGNWASNGKYVNAMNKGDSIDLYYTAKKAGEYTATITYKSGAASNGLEWSEQDGKVEAGSATVGADDEAREVHTKDITLKVLEPGEGKLTFKAPVNNAPQLDKITITPKNIVQETFTVTAVAGENGEISPVGTQTVTEGDNISYTITPNSGYKISSLKVNGEAVEPTTSYTLEDIQKDTTVEVEFAFANYTEENPFIFPNGLARSAATTNLEAEHFILNNKDENGNEPWKLEVAKADWASNGEFVNAMNNEDEILLYYNAQRPGKYKLVASYRSGDPNNGLIWSEKEGQIEAGSETVGANDNASATHTKELIMNITKPGAGCLVLTAPEKNAPQLDKFDVSYLEETPIPEEYTLTASVSGEGGTIDPAGEIKVSKGADQRFDFTAEDGYVVDEVLVNGASIGAVEYYTMENISEDASIVVSFKVKEEAEVDKTKLNAAIVEAKGKLQETDQYTAESLVGLEEVVTAAEEVMNNPEATQEEVNEAAQNLKDALAALVEIEKPVVDKSALEETINEAKGKLQAVDKYTAASLAELQKAVTAAEEMMNNPEATQEEVNSAAQNVTTALAGLVESEPNKVDKTALEEAIKEAKEKLQETDLYTKESLANLQAMVAAAEEVMNDGKATQADVDAKAQGVREAIKALAKIEKPTTSVDKAALEKVIKEAKEKLQETDNYTKESLAQLKEELTVAEGIINNPDATQEQVDHEVAKLQDSLQNLQPVSKETKPAVTDKIQNHKVEQGKGVKTGDNVNTKAVVGLSILCVSMLGLMIAVVVKRKKSK